MVENYAFHYFFNKTSNTSYFAPLSDWEQRKLIEFVDDVGTGKSTFTSSREKSPQYIYPVLGSTNVISYDQTYDYSGNFILTARVGANAGRLYTYQGRVKISDNTVYIQTDNRSFIYNLLLKFNLKKLSYGTGQPLIKSSELKKLKIWTPDSNQEQISIGEFLMHMESVITLHQRKINILKELKQEYLRLMFANNERSTPMLRFKQFEIDWEQRAINSVYNITMGHSPKSENYTSNPEDYVLVQGNADIINGWVSPRVWTTQITSLIKAGSILISVRAPVGNVGKTAYDVVIGRGIAAFEGDEFLYQLLNKMHIEGYWRKVSTGSTFESINSKDIKEAPIHLPEQKERNEIGKFLNMLDSYTALHQEKLNKLSKVKQSYLKKMFI